MLQNCALLTLAIGLCGILQAETFYGPTTLVNKKFDTLTIHGPAILKKVKVNSLTVHGSLAFSEIEVSGKGDIYGSVEGVEGKFIDVMVKGSLNAEKIQMKSLYVQGLTVLKDFTFTSDVSILGRLNAIKGTFQNLTAGSEEPGEVVFLEDVKAHNIVLNKNIHGTLLELSRQTFVSGSIRFQWGEGTVEKGKYAQISGPIEGGALKE